VQRQAAAALRREGSYLLRSNINHSAPEKLWRMELKGELSIRPIYHQLDERIEAHILIAFLPIACK